ncbi:hypothetical protein ACFQY0_19000 [Haloferula chungangensis]|uniref:Uncharacterized protein n=1 Tax=Haloferula chungangensis TaxID=1048331 RepID=A0ABW2LD48_9BACT
MSDNDNKPSKQTSSVPLKKETVRVTLKAADAPSASPTGAPPAPAAPKPTMSAPKPTVSAPKPPTVATKPPTAAGGAPPAPAPTIPLRTAGAPTAGGAPAPAPTIKLNTAPASAGAPTVALKTAGAPSAPGAGAPSVALPKATVQLQPPTQPMSTGGISTQAATMQQADDEEESTGTSPVVIALSVLGLLGAAAVLFLQVSTASIWINAEDNSAQGEWSQLF